MSNTVVPSPSAELGPWTGSEIIEAASGAWLFRIEPLNDDGVLPTEVEAGSLAAVRATAKLLETLPALPRSFANQGVRVIFSKETTGLLRQGAGELMKSGEGLRPIVRDVASGRLIEIGKVAGGAGLKYGALAAAGPILAVAAIAAAISFAEQRAMERRFAELQRAVDRLEIRLRDDDVGTLEAADSLVDHLQPDLADGNLAPQLGTELAIARREVERIYLSRRRFAERFAAALEQTQNEKDEKSSERMRSGWTSRIADELKDRKSGVVDELALFVQAMVVRARIGAATAAVIAWQGDGDSALRIIDDLDREMKQDFYQLYRRLRALARFGPDSTKPWWQTLPGLNAVPLIAGGKPDDSARQKVAGLVERMETLLGSAIEAHDRDVAVVVPAGVLELAGSR